MTFAYTGGDTDGVSSGTSVTVTHNQSISSGDLVVAYVNTNDTTEITADAGGATFTRAIDETPSSETAHHAFFWKIAGVSEPSTYTFSWTNSASARGIVQVFLTSATDAAQDLAAASDRNSGPLFDIAVGTAEGRTVADNSLSVIFGGKDNRNDTAGGELYTSTTESFLGPVGHTDNEMCAGAYKIFVTGETISSTGGSIIIEPADASDGKNATPMAFTFRLLRLVPHHQSSPWHHTITETTQDQDFRGQINAISQSRHKHRGSYWPCSCGR